jgi:hypothetical protein
MLDADVQAAKLDESLARIGASVDVEPLLRAKAAFNDMFKAGTGAGDYMAVVWHRIAQPIQNLATWGWTLLRTFFMNVIIGALHIEIAFRKLMNATLRMLLNSGIAKLWPLIKRGLAEYRDYLEMLGSTAGKIAKWAGLIVLVTVFGGIALAAALVAAAIVIVVAVIGGLWLGVKKIWAFLTETNWKKVGVSFIDLGVSLMHGLLHGIASGLTWVINGVKKMGLSIWAALKATLKSASPSRLFAELGTTIPLGVALGITAATPAATQAMDRSGQAVIGAGAQSLKVPTMPASAMAQPVGAAGGGGGKAVTVNVGGITITASGDSAQSIATDIGGELTKVLEAIALQLGGGADGGN